MDNPKWKKFEKLVFEIQKDFSGDAQVTPDDHIMGVDSKTSRQIDISIKRRIAQYEILIAIECKDTKSPVDVKDVGEFITTIKDIRANKGAIVSATGFTASAVEIAKVHNIDTFRFVDTESIDWRTYASVPALLERNFIKNFRFIFRDITQPLKIVNIDPRHIRVFDSSGDLLGGLQNVVAKKWNNQEMRHNPGRVEIFLGNFIEIEDRKVPARVFVECDIEREFYFGNLPINVRGFHDVQSGGVITKSLTTNPIEPFKIENGNDKNWKKVDDPEKFATKLFMKVSYSDVLPTT